MKSLLKFVVFKETRAVFILHCLLLVGFAYSQEGVVKVEDQDMDAVVAKLGDKSYNVRSEAMAQLWQMGSGREEELKKYKDSEDPQVRFNLNLVSNYLFLGLPVGIDKERLERIDRVLTTDDYKKVEEDIKILLKEKEYEALIKMHLLHDSDPVKLYLRLIVDNIIRVYLRELYDQDDFTKAESLLKMLDKSDTVAQCYASLLVYKEASEGFIGSMAENDKEAMVVALYIYLAKKRWSEALVLAEKLGKESLCCKLNLFMGKSDKLLSYKFQSKRYPMQIAALNTAKAIDENDFEKAKKLQDALANTSKHTTNSKTILLRSELLMLNGIKDHLDGQVEKFYLGADDTSFSSNMVNYCVNSGRIDAFYTAINCPKSKGDQLIWAKNIIKGVQKNKEVKLDLGVRSELSKLMHYIYYLSLNNERKLVSELLDPLIEVGISRLANKEMVGNQELFVNMTAHSLSYGYDWYVFDAMHSFNPEAFALFSNTIEDILSDKLGLKNLKVLKSSLEKVDKVKGVKLTESKQLEKVLLLLGFTRQSKSFEVLDIQQNILDVSLKEEEAEEVFDVLFSAASNRGDMQSVKKLASVIEGLQEDEYRFFTYRQKILMAESKWEEAYTYTNSFYTYLQEKRKSEQDAQAGETKQGLLTQSNISDMLNDLIILEKLSRRKEADLLRKKLKLYISGDVEHDYFSMSQFSSWQLNENYIDSFESLFFNRNLQNSAIIEAVRRMNLQMNAYLKSGKYTEAYAVAIFHKFLSISRFTSSSPLEALRISNQADLTKGLSLFEASPQLAEKYLRRCVETSLNGGLLADFYFPAVEKIAQKQLHKEGFELVRKEMVAILKKYPRNPNALNGYAWTAAKAGYDLDNAKIYSERSLELSPFNSAYLDTLAEVHFAQGDREGAIKYSQNALDMTFSGKERGNNLSSNNGSYSHFMSAISNRKMLNEQFEHFKNDALPH